jgi:hypothetical protein
VIGFQSKGALPLCFGGAKELLVSILRLLFRVNRIDYAQKAEWKNLHNMEEIL